jgi:hypothetical protein
MPKQSRTYPAFTFRLTLRMGAPDKDARGAADAHRVDPVG